MNKLEQEKTKKQKKITQCPFMTKATGLSHNVFGCDKKKDYWRHQVSKKLNYKYEQGADKLNVE